MHGHPSLVGGSSLNPILEDTATTVAERAAETEAVVHHRELERITEAERISRRLERTASPNLRPTNPPAEEWIMPSPGGLQEFEKVKSMGNRESGGS